MTLRPVGFAAARVALHWSARSKDYKLSREGADPRSLLGGVDVLARCVCVVSSSSRPSPLDVAPASPFIVSKEMTRVTFMVKR
jgi:hypothetical protein